MNIEDLKKEYKLRNNKRLQTLKGNVVVYHGTSVKAAEKIIKEGYFKDGFFMGSLSPIEYGDSVYNYAKIRAKQAFEKGNGMVLKMIVEPESISINGAGELESIGDLYLDNGVWKNKIIKQNIDIENINNLTPSKIAKKLSISINSASRFILVNIRYLYFQNNVKNSIEINRKMNEFIDEFLEMSIASPRKFNSRAKDYEIDKKIFLADLMNLKDFNLSKLF